MSYMELPSGSQALLAEAVLFVPKICRAPHAVGPALSFCREKNRVSQERLGLVPTSPGADV